MNINKLIKKWEKELGPLTFGNSIRCFRESEDMSLAEYAKILGIAKASLQKLEDGSQIPSPKRVIDIAKKLGYSEQCLMELALRDHLKKHGLDYNVRLVKQA